MGGLPVRPKESVCLAGTVQAASSQTAIGVKGFSGGGLATEETIHACHALCVAARDRSSSLGSDARSGRAAARRRRGDAAAAQSLPATDDGELEEIVVTAQKCAEKVQDLDIEYVWGNSMPVATIRGIGMNDFQADSKPGVGYYVDEDYLPSIAPMGLQLFEMERLEVLKGPQGTLYGRNTNGGACFQHVGSWTRGLTGMTAAPQRFCTAVLHGRLDPANCVDLLQYSHTDGDVCAGDYTVRNDLTCNGNPLDFDDGKFSVGARYLKENIDFQSESSLLLPPGFGQDNRVVPASEFELTARPRPVAWPRRTATGQVRCRAGTPSGCSSGAS